MPLCRSEEWTEGRGDPIFRLRSNELLTNFAAVENQEGGNAADDIAREGERIVPHVDLSDFRPTLEIRQRVGQSLARSSCRERSGLPRNPREREVQIARLLCRSWHRRESGSFSFGVSAMRKVT
jgi:hypothetical protein